MLAPWKESYDKPRQRIRKQRHHFSNKGPYSQSYAFSNRHVWMWELDHQEGWAPENWCFPTVVLGKTLEIALDSKEIRPVNPKGNQPWISLERLALKLKLQYFGHLMWRGHLLEKALICCQTRLSDSKITIRILWGLLRTDHAPPPYHSHTSMSSPASQIPKNIFNQRGEKMQKQRKTFKYEKIIIT